MKVDVLVFRPPGSELGGSGARPRRRTSLATLSPRDMCSSTTMEKSQFSNQDEPYSKVTFLAVSGDYG